MRERVAAYATVAVHAGAGQDDDPPPAAAVPPLAEDRMAALHGASAAVGAANPAAARLSLFQAIMRPGSEFIVAANTAVAIRSQFQSWSEAFGWTVRLADPLEGDSFAGEVSPRTQAIFCQTLGQAGEGVADLAALAGFAKRAEVPLIVDNSLATSFLCRPIDFGADVVIESAAPLIAGDRVGGSFVIDGGSFDWAGSGRYPRLAGDGGEAAGGGNVALAGICRRLLDSAERLSPGDASRLLDGLETLSLRLRHRCESAKAIAGFLIGREDVGFVSYPGLAGDRHWTLARSYLGNAGGVALRFGLRGGRDAETRLASALQLVGTQASLGQGRSSLSVDGGRGVVLAAGLEEAGDIIADLEQALSA
jgi:O-acetylhomoserine (thiol)-lyase